MGKQEMTPWMPEDDIAIMQLLKEMGPRWGTIAARFPGRTVSSVRNRFLRLDAGHKLRQAGQMTKNRCHTCGQPKKGHICVQKMKERDVTASVLSGGTGSSMQQAQMQQMQQAQMQKAQVQQAQMQQAQMQQAQMQQAQMQQMRLDAAYAAMNRMHQLKASAPGAEIHPYPRIWGDGATEGHHTVTLSQLSTLRQMQERERDGEAPAARLQMHMQMHPQQSTQQYQMQQMQSEIARQQQMQQMQQMQQVQQVQQMQQMQQPQMHPRAQQLQQAKPPPALPPPASMRSSLAPSQPPPRPPGAMLPPPETMKTQPAETEPADHFLDVADDAFDDVAAAIGTEAIEVAAAGAPRDRLSLQGYDSTSSMQLPVPSQLAHPPPALAPPAAPLQDDLILESLEQPQAPPEGTSMVALSGPPPSFPSFSNEAMYNVASLCNDGDSPLSIRLPQIMHASSLLTQSGRGSPTA